MTLCRRVSVANKQSTAAVSHTQIAGNAALPFPIPSQALSAQAYQVRCAVSTTATTRLTHTALCVVVLHPLLLHQPSDPLMDTCRRTLDSPDFQLLERFDEPCTCGSTRNRASCCFTSCYSNEGGVLWPLFHCCGCDNPFDTYSNPQVIAVSHKFKFNSQ